MNAGEMSREINVMLAKMDEQYDLARKAVGIKPDLQLAKERVNDAGATVMELAELLDHMVGMGYRHPPDVVQRVKARYERLHELALEIYNDEITLQHGVMRSHNFKDLN